MATKLIELTNADRGFYTTLGPFLANRAVHKALGGVPWDDDTKTWLVLKDTTKGVLGFVAVATHGTRTTVESLYVTNPRHRRVATELVAHAADRYGTRRSLHTVVRAEMAYAYEQAGFTATGETGNFTRMTRPATKETAGA